MTNSPTTSGRQYSITLVVIGFMLFAMFFGAGNLIFPPQLGVTSGTNYVPAISGFLTTAVLLPMLAVFAVVLSGSGIVDIASRAGKVFGIAFSVAVYLAIGALYAIPRTATVPFESGISQLMGTDSSLALFLFTLAFFAVSYWLIIQPGGIVDTIGKFLTPALLILIVTLIVAGLAKLTGVPSTPAENWADSPYTAGFLEGYLTMDSLAALVFSIVVISSLKRSGITERPLVVRSTIIASVIAVALLGAVYLGLGALGQKMSGAGEFENGAAVLAQAAETTLGTAGLWVFAGIVTLACLTTAVGLISATSEFFHELLPKVSYRGWATIFTVAGLFMANMGLNTIIEIAIPLNVFLYPMAVTLILITLIQAVLPFKLVWAYRIPVAVSLVFAFIDVMRFIGFDMADVLTALHSLPLYQDSLGWLVPVALSFVVCVFIDRSQNEPAPVVGEGVSEYSG